MKVNAALVSGLASVPEAMRSIEETGYDAVFSAEINNDPFLPLLLAAEHSERIGLMTAVSVAFARNPMIVANIGHDLQQYSRGRFRLGLGSQIEPHITKRYSMPWSRPAARMREFVLALRAIWACWHEGKKLDFRGEFYRHTLMTPMFTPTSTDFAPPPILIAGVRPRMTEVAGEVADGFVGHGFTTERYLREVTVPALERGLAKAGRLRDDFDVSAPIVVITGRDEAAFVQCREIVKMQLAFYGSTPAYRPVLDLHGWGDLHPELNRLSKEGKWQQMGELLDDEFLAMFAVVAENPDEVPTLFAERYGDLIDTWQCTVNLNDDDAQADFVRRIQSIAARGVRP